MRFALVLLLALAGCAHAAIKEVSDCEKLTGEQRLACGACLLQNQAQGWLGVFEYRPDNAQGERCVKVK
jgi:hypothetical protein